MGSGVYFSLAVKKYGRENFRRQILRLCYSDRELGVWEYVFIKKYNSQDKNIGYNIASGDVNENGHNPAFLPEVKEKMIKANRRTTSNEEYRKKQSEIMKEYYKTHKNGFAGKKHSEETREKIRLLMLGRPAYNKGIPISEEQRKKQSEIMKGKYVGSKNPNYRHGKYVNKSTR